MGEKKQSAETKLTASRQREYVGEYTVKGT